MNRGNKDQGYLVMKAKRNVHEKKPPNRESNPDAGPSVETKSSLESATEQEIHVKSKLIN